MYVDLAIPFWWLQFRFFVLYEHFSYESLRLFYRIVNLYRSFIVKLYELVCLQVVYMSKTSRRFKENAIALKT